MSKGYREDGAERFKSITNRLDGTRPTLANMFTFNDELSLAIDVQGFSHKDRATLGEIFVFVLFL